MSFVLFSLTEQNIFQNKQTKKSLPSNIFFFGFFLDDKDKCVQIFK